MPEPIMRATNVLYNTDALVETMISIYRTYPNVWFAVIGAKTSISTAAMPMTLKASPVFEFIKIDN